MTVEPWRANGWKPISEGVNADAPFTAWINPWDGDPQSSTVEMNCHFDLVGDVVDSEGNVVGNVSHIRPNSFSP